MAEVPAVRGDGGQVCRAAAVVPHPTRPSLLGRLTAGAGPAALVELPAVDVSVEPTTEEVVTALSAALGRAVVPLRTVAVAWTDDFDTTAMVVELEPGPAQPPQGHAWRPVVPQPPAVSPAWASEQVQAWAVERTEGWSALRPAWARPGWYATASAWMQERMAALGMPEPTTPRVHQLWAASVVLSADSREGRAFLKCSPQRFRHEAVLTQELGRTSPHRLPQVLDVDPDRGWLLMRDFGGSLLGDRPETEWAPGLVAMAGLQHDWLGRTDELLGLGAEHRGLAELASWVASLVDDDALLGRLDADVRAEWRAAVPELAEACARLDSTGPAPTLVHGDLHPGNVAVRQRGVLLFDWTDAAVSHPFVDLVTYATRAGSPAAQHALVDAYLACWSDVLDATEREEAGRLALLVGSLYQTRTYTELLPTLLPADLGSLREGDVDWAVKALRRLREAG